jgi:NAD(P)-dependent dehydrogenase (short-subunit alcohol dehydrogenase family)
VAVRIGDAPLDGGAIVLLSSCMNVRGLAGYTMYNASKAADEFRRAAAAMVPLGRLGAPEELASAALFLASSDSSYATGIDLVIDGGMTQI